MNDQTLLETKNLIEEDIFNQIDLLTVSNLKMGFDMSVDPDFIKASIKNLSDMLLQERDSERLRRKTAYIKSSIKKDQFEPIRGLINDIIYYLESDNNRDNSLMVLKLNIILNTLVDQQQKNNQLPSLNFTLIVRNSLKLKIGLQVWRDNALEKLIVDEHTIVNKMFDIYMDMLEHIDTIIDTLLAVETPGKKLRILAAKAKYLNEESYDEKEDVLFLKFKKEYYKFMQKYNLKVDSESSFKDYARRGIGLIGNNMEVYIKSDRLKYQLYENLYEIILKPDSIEYDILYKANKTIINDLDHQLKS